MYFSRWRVGWKEEKCEKSEKDAKKVKIRVDMVGYTC